MSIAGSARYCSAHSHTSGSIARCTRRQCAHCTMVGQTSRALKIHRRRPDGAWGAPASGLAADQGRRRRGEVHPATPGGSIAPLRSGTGDGLAAAFALVGPARDHRRGRLIPLRRPRGRPRVALQRGSRRGKSPTDRGRRCSDPPAPVGSGRTAISVPERWNRHGRPGPRPRGPSGHRSARPSVTRDVAQARRPDSSRSPAVRRLR